MKRFWVYILSNHSRRLYIGVTNDLTRRVWQHKTQESEGFSARYNLTFLVHHQEFGDVRDAIEREKELKKWARAKKLVLIEAENPAWEDLSADWFDKAEIESAKRDNIARRETENSGSSN
ncbi:MAG TPA: GIY-YIG nuclease family protein [Abditibacterium sp.]|jgi:putative endonuclease